MIQYQYPGFEKLIDKYGFDILLMQKMYGDRLPFVSPGWTLLFEDSTSAMYLKKNDLNQANLVKIIDYYKKMAIPFDSQRGFDLKALKRLDFDTTL
jgi:hypothetical protein